MIDRIGAQGGMGALAGARPRGHWGRWLIAGLAILNLLALGSVFLVGTRSESTPEVVVVSPALREGAAAVSSLVEQHRDGSGRYPLNLGAVWDRLTPEVIEMIRRGDITYWTSPDNLQYKVGMWPPGTISARARSWRASSPRRRRRPHKLRDHGATVAQEREEPLEERVCLRGWRIAHAAAPQGAD
jgi:hypothetical protein